MTREEAIKKNPFNPNKGNESAYCRYLRYNVDGWYNLDSKEVLRRWRSEEEEMYESPIEKIYGELQTQMAQEDEEMVMKAIRKVGVNVDKESLIKALQYDRNQYTKGYEDGKNEVLDKIRAEIFKCESDCRLTVDDYACSRCTDKVFGSIYNILDKYKDKTESEDGNDD